jgi:hypothetical protein
MNCQAFTNDSLTMMYEAIRGALAADDAWKRQGLAIRFRVRETPDWKKHAREKYESLLRCPMCDRTGLADMSDNKSTKIGDYDTRVEAVTQGFEVKGKDVICSECQVSAL